MTGALFSSRFQPQVKRMKDHAAAKKHRFGCVEIAQGDDEIKALLGPAFMALVIRQLAPCWLFVFLSLLLFPHPLLCSCVPFLDSCHVRVILTQ